MKNTKWRVVLWIVNLSLDIQYFLLKVGKFAVIYCVWEVAGLPYGELHKGRQAGRSVWFVTIPLSLFILARETKYLNKVNILYVPSHFFSLP